MGEQEIEKGQPLPSMAAIWLEVLGLTLALLLVPVLVYLDNAVFFDYVTEGTLTELAQAALIGLTSVLFFIGARRDPRAAAYLMGVATLTAAMFLRENDALFDRIQHGFWAYPVALLLLAGLVYMLRHRGTFRGPFRHHMASREAVFFILGFLVVLFFSRVFGSGELWRGVMGAAYNFQYKAAIQEGIELLGYMLIGYGAVASYRNRFGQP